MGYFRSGILFFLLLLSCNTKETPPIEVCFYHWKQTFAPTAFEKIQLQQLGTKKIFIKFFDVDWHPELKVPVPLAELSLKETSGYAFVPVVFITNRTLKNISVHQLDGLAQKISSKIQFLAKGLFINEVQLDCDWSESTREKFFTLCRLMKQKNKDWLLSCTVRLHQIKYSKATGVPPVHLGTLMLYNMGELDGSNTHNSILDVRLTQQYLEALDTYPLPLDLALPIFGWAVLQRQQKVIALFNHVTENDLQLHKLKKINTQAFEVQENHYFKGKFLYKGDKIRLEQVEASTLQETIQLVSKKLAPNRQVVFYHLDSTLLSNYNHEKIKGLLEHFY